MLSVSIPACSGKYADVETPMFSKNKIEEVKNEFNVEVFPNPSASTFLLKTNSIIGENTTITITDLKGRCIKRIVLAPGKTIRFGDNLLSGTYYLQCNQGKNRITKKIMML